MDATQKQLLISAGANDADIEAAEAGYVTFDFDLIEYELSAEACE